ncbi:polysaccharide deacetylase family protein [Devosia sp. A8/3-2]|nr:polysaccharide deacetylase family protein [Devosia sp. A8/3-2]
MTRVKSSASTATQDTVTLDGLQREAKAQRDLLEGYLQRYNEAISRTDSNSALPDVRVISVAAPSVTPASPRTQMVLLAVGIVSVALQVGIIIFSELISGRAIVPGARPQDELEEVPFSEDELEPDQRWEEPAAAEAAPGKDEPAPERIEPVVAVQDEPAAPAPLVEEPEIAAETKAPAEPVRANLLPANTISYSQLASDLVLGRTHLVILAGQSSNEDCEDLAEELVGDALAKGLSVATVDAGSGRASDEAGLTDLSTESVSFGDVVHKSADNSFAEVPRGQGTAIDRRSSKPITLIEAPGDIYEVVVIMTGPVGMASTLSMFGALDGRILLVAPKDEPFDSIRADPRPAGRSRLRFDRDRRRPGACCCLIGARNVAEIYRHQGHVRGAVAVPAARLATKPVGLARRHLHPASGPPRCAGRFLAQCHPAGAPGFPRLRHRARSRVGHRHCQLWTKPSERLKASEKGRPFVVLTFDDAYKDNLQYALPVLRRHEAPFTLYVPTATVDGVGDIWWQAIEDIIARRDAVALTRGDETDYLDTRSTAEKQQAYDTLYWRMRKMPEADRVELMHGFARSYGYDWPSNAGP